MAIKILKPVTAGTRNSSVQDFSDITASKPNKSLTVWLKTKAGRNNQGKITTRHHGSGVKRLYRLVDFKMQKYDVPGKIESVEYDPYRSARIMLLKYPESSVAYALAPVGVKVGETITSFSGEGEIKTGNRLMLKHIPVGMAIHNLEMTPGKGGEVVRSAGSLATIMAKEGNMVQVKMPSGEIRNYMDTCRASIGQVSNVEWRNVRWGKAGRNRLRGIRPTVRGKAQNPVDHPHGGGEGNQPIGLKNPKTPWGKPALGVITRKDHKRSDSFIVRRRPKRIGKIK